MALISKPFGDIITFTRSSGGGRFNAQGKYEWLSSNQPRIDYDPLALTVRGLLIEEQRTNLLKYSEQFNDGVWSKSKSTVSANIVAAPDGTVTADKIVEDTTAGAHYVDQVVSGTYTSGDKYVSSVFVKAAERTTVSLINYYAVGNASGKRTKFDLSSGQVTYTEAESSGIEHVGNGWYRCWQITSVDTPSETRLLFRILLGSAGGDSYTGDGSSGLYVWGAQLEAGRFSTSYIPTTSAQVTRAADVATISSLSPWYNASEGTLFVEFQYRSDILGNVAAAFTNSNGANEIAIRGANGSGTGPYGQVTEGAVTQAALTDGNAVANTKYLAALAYKANDIAFCWGGRAVKADTSATIPTVSVLSLGGLSYSTGSQMNGHIRRLRYYPKRLSNAELQELTAA